MLNEAISFLKKRFFTIDCNNVRPLMLWRSVPAIVMFQLEISDLL